MEKNARHNGWKNYETWKVMLEFFDGHTVDQKIDADYCYDLLTEYLEICDYADSRSNFKESLTDTLLTQFVAEIDFDEIADAINEQSGIENECEMCGKPISYYETTCSGICFEASMR